jgi:hypothetical protein
MSECISYPINTKLGYRSQSPVIPNQNQRCAAAHRSVLYIAYMRTAAAVEQWPHEFQMRDVLLAGCTFT